MADPAIETPEVTNEAKPRKSRKLLWALLSVVVVGGAAAAVLFLGPALGLAPAFAKSPEGPEAAPKIEPGKVVNLRPVVVDVRDAETDLHHLKVGLSAELAPKVAEDQFYPLEPRAREAAITYLRTLSFEDATLPEKFPELKKELSRLMIEATGKSNVHRIIITDFVAQ